VRLTSSEQRTGQPNAVDVSGIESQIRGLGGPVQTLGSRFPIPSADGFDRRPSRGKLGNFGGFATPGVTQRNAKIPNASNFNALADAEL
jgi:hypothetical protein